MAFRVIIQSNMYPCRLATVSTSFTWRILKRSLRKLQIVTILVFDEACTCKAGNNHSEFCFHTANSSNKIAAEIFLRNIQLSDQISNSIAEKNYLRIYRLSINSKTKSLHVAFPTKPVLFQIYSSIFALLLHFFPPTSNRKRNFIASKILSKQETHELALEGDKINGALYSRKQITTTLIRKKWKRQ